MKSIDSETTGLDLRHGAKPFFVSCCDTEGDLVYWEWRVNPKTRDPIIPKSDIKEIRELFLDDEEEFVFQNPKFDIRAFEVIGVFDGINLDKIWSRIYDTLLADHLLCSNERHDLTSLSKKYLRIDCSGYEDHLKQVCNKARNLARRDYKDWMIAKKGLPCMPSAKETVWKNDLWLPREIAIKEGYPKDHEFHNVCKEYGNNDTETTLAIFFKQIEQIKRKGLLEIYKERLKLLPVIYKMESKGITASKERLLEIKNEFKEKSKQAETICINIAKTYNYDVELPKSGNNKSLSKFLFNVIKIPVMKTSKKTGEPSLDKNVLEELELTLPRRSKQLSFVRNLKGKRKRDTALNFVDSYEKFWLPNCKTISESLDSFLLRELDNLISDLYILFPSLNPTGTNTLRFSSQNPNAQQISKQEGFNLRYIFGPAPGREWWSLDANNIELRLPAFEAGETEMIDLFIRPDDPPYYGSYHLLVFSILHPDKFKKYGAECKKIFASTWYQWTKNGNFAVQYGAVESSGTADKAYRIVGAQKRIASRFSNITKLNRYQIEFAQKNGYVETIPDKTVNPERGYPLQCTRTRWGGILETVPLNYHIQGSAMWWMSKAMVRCNAYLESLNKNRKENQKAYMIMQVHDELVFDFPKSKSNDGGMPSNFTVHISNLKSLMEKGGDDFGIPTPVGVDYHSNNWSQSVTCA